MSLANVYDESLSTGKIKELKLDFNVMGINDIREGIQVVEMSINNEKEAMTEFYKNKKQQMSQRQIDKRKAEEKNFSLEDFGDLREM